MKGLRLPREFDFGGQWDLITEFLQDRETDFQRAQTKPCAHQDPGERSSDPTGDGARLACECPGGSGLRPSNREGTQPRPSTEDWTKNLLSMAPTIRARLRFPLSQSLPSGSFHKLLILTHQRANRKKTTITEDKPN